MITSAAQWNAMSHQEQLAWSLPALPEQRLTVMNLLSAEAWAQSQRELRDENPNATEIELKVLFVHKHYGEDLALRFGEHLAQRAKAALMHETPISG